MLIRDTNRIRSSQPASDNVGRTLDHLAQKVRDQFHIQVSRIGGRRWFIGQTEAEQIDCVNSKRLREYVEIFTPLKAGLAGANTVNEDDWHAEFSQTRFFVEDSTVLPAEVMGRTTQHTVVRFERILSNGGVDGSECCEPRTTRQHRLPKISELAH